jgi:hypothetical protein
MSGRCFRIWHETWVDISHQGSSIGTYSTMWTNEFICSCRGESAETWLDVPKSRRQKLSHPSGLKIVFPSLQTVRDSRLGERGGGTIFCRRSQWEGTRFPRELFHDSRSKRGGVLMHSKVCPGLSRSGMMADSMVLDDYRYVRQTERRACEGSSRRTPEERLRLGRRLG